MQAHAAAELDVRKVVAHLALLVAVLVMVHGNLADAKLAAKVLAPALGRAAGEHRARVLHARGDSDGHRSAAEVDRRQVVAHLTSCAATVVHVTVAELAAPAKAPALHAAAARKHRAHVLSQLAETELTRTPLPRSTGCRLSPISPGSSPRCSVLPVPS